MFENYVVLLIVMLWIKFSVWTYGQTHGMSFRSKLKAPKHCFSQNKWFLPLCWCSSDYILRTVLTHFGLYNPKHHFSPQMLTFYVVIDTFRIT